MKRDGRQGREKRSQEIAEGRQNSIIRRRLAGVRRWRVIRGSKMASTEREEEVYRLTRV